MRTGGADPAAPPSPSRARSQINVQACTDRRIQVSNVPVAVDGATADTALFLMLGALRQFNVAQANLRAGKFNAGLEMSHDPEGKVVRPLFFLSSEVDAERAS